MTRNKFGGRLVELRQKLLKVKERDTLSMNFSLKPFAFGDVICGNEF